ncbi:unnamed protein product [Acanthoscelides obtectus]|uniref:Uncharacterized protein n=1 Tax=Acanthoscelides obtectus TaxID=200917 RepID=A0A9P0LCU4_ACAOB|nr:unnamed protein product [Acanthoscelides obtectus]CAK1629524.1 hypothetical protein AOBTE_LOCUS5793 [Acanthoscelides obtectus]
MSTILRNTLTQDRLTALSMLSIEKEFISTMENFNGKVIDKFTAKKERRIELTYKKIGKFGFAEHLFYLATSRL